MSPGKLRGLDVRAPGEARSAVPGDPAPADRGRGICSPCPIRHPGTDKWACPSVAGVAPSTSLFTAQTRQVPERFSLMPGDKAFSTRVLLGRNLWARRVN